MYDAASMIWKRRHSELLPPPLCRQLLELTLGRRYLPVLLHPCSVFLSSLFSGAKWDEETKSDGMPRPDNSRRVQFDSNANSDGDIHPLLKGVCLDATAPGEAAPTAQVTAEPPGDGLSSIAAGATGVSDPALPNSSPAEAKSSDKGTGARR